MTIKRALKVADGIVRVVVFVLFVIMVLWPRRSYVGELAGKVLMGGILIYLVINIVFGLIGLAVWLVAKIWRRHKT